MTEMMKTEEVAAWMDRCIEAEQKVENLRLALYTFGLDVSNLLPEAKKKNLRQLLQDAYLAGGVEPWKA